MKPKIRLISDMDKSSFTGSVVSTLHNTLSTVLDDSILLIFEYVQKSDEFVKKIFVKYLYCNKMMVMGGTHILSFCFKPLKELEQTLCWETS